MTAPAEITVVASEWTDYWTCNVGFAAGIPVRNSYFGWPPISRRCRAMTPVFFDRCRRCGMPRGWEAS